MNLRLTNLHYEDDIYSSSNYIVNEQYEKQPTSPYLETARASRTGNQHNASVVAQIFGTKSTPNIYKSQSTQTWSSTVIVMPSAKETSPLSLRNGSCKGRLGIRQSQDLSRRRRRMCSRSLTLSVPLSFHPKISLFEALQISNSLAQSPNNLPNLGDSSARTTHAK